MYLSFSTLPSLRTNAPQFVASFDDGFSGLTKYLLDSGKKALADIRSSSLAGRVNWKIALPVCLLVLAATSCIFYLAKRNNALKAEVESLAADNATISGLKGQISTLEQELKRIALELTQKTEEPSKPNPMLAEQEEAIAQLKKQISVLEQAKQSKQPDSDFGALKEENEHILKLLEQIKTLEQEKEKIALELAQKTEELSKLPDQLKELPEKIAQLELQIGAHEQEKGQIASKSAEETGLKIKELEETIQQLTIKISSFEEAKAAEAAAANSSGSTTGEKGNGKRDTSKISTMLKKELERTKELSEELEALKKEHTALSTDHKELQESSSAMYTNSSLINKEIRELKERNELLEDTLQKIAEEGQENASFSEE